MSACEKQRKGHVAKLQAMSKYVAKGYYIFEECNQGFIDFIAINNTGDIHLVEVKALAIRKTGKQKGIRINRILSDSQKDLNKKLKDKYGNLQVKIEYVDISEHC